MISDKDIVINTTNSKVILLEPGIIENHVNSGTNIDTQDILELKEANMKLTEGKPYAILVTSGEMTTISKEARELTSSKEFVLNTVANAILVENLGHQLVGNFYLNINKPHIDTKLFNKREKALEWLRSKMKKFR